MVRDSARILLQIPAPIGIDGGPKRQTLSLSRTLERRATQTGKERSVLVFHNHNAVSPTVKGVVERCGKSPGKTGFGVIYKRSIRVADDTVRIQKDALRN